MKAQGGFVFQTLRNEPAKNFCQARNILSRQGTYFTDKEYTSQAKSIFNRQGTYFTDNEHTNRQGTYLADKEYTSQARSILIRKIFKRKQHF